MRSKSFLKQNKVMLKVEQSTCFGKTLQLKQQRYISIEEEQTSYYLSMHVVCFLIMELVASMSKYNGYRRLVRMVASMSKYND
jgi:hypothetical protein